MKTKFIINLSILLFITVLNGCGRGDNTPIDTDGDGIEDSLDLFPNDPTEAFDTDEDGIGDNGDNCVDIVNSDPLKDHVVEIMNPSESDLQDEDSQNDWLLRNVYTQHHSSGTCKMGTSDDKMAVVDQYCKVFGLNNLRVVDASVMPDVIRANTNATTMMIAEKVADWINNN